MTVPRKITTQHTGKEPGTNTDEHNLNTTVGTGQEPMSRSTALTPFLPGHHTTAMDNQPLQPTGLRRIAPDSHLPSRCHRRPDLSGLHLRRRLPRIPTGASPPSWEQSTRGEPAAAIPSFPLETDSDSSPFFHATMELFPPIPAPALLVLQELLIYDVSCATGEQMNRGS